ncbi:RNA-binding La domain-containing protein [Zostera marina]|uniref:RNA-binding La domain-containing protein n=1 Tax=Zostera marina TaxID=29655 RepID=A0A0K9Q1C3_ZOSMR|nr:RNA-binding La domain-containing protein [Zostera marina]
MSISAFEGKKAKDVMRQVQFYFSDSNLPKDNFLKKTVAESEGGLVALNLICSFAKMKSHLGLKDDVKPDMVPEDVVLSVAETLKNCSTLKISEDCKRVGRSTEIPNVEEIIEQVDSRTVAVSPLPYNVTIEDIESFFSEHGTVNSVRLPRLLVDKRLFCGTALVEFSDEGEAKTALGKTLVYEGADLELKTKKDFDSEREKNKVEFAKSYLEKSCSENNPKDSCSYPKGLILGFKLKKVSSEDHVNKTVQPKDDASDGVEEICDDVVVQKTESINVENSNESSKPDGAADEKKDTESQEEIVKREDLKEIFQKFGTVKFIDFKIGDESGFIRFEDPDASSNARAAALISGDESFTVKKSVLTLQSVTGDAEKEYWATLRTGQGRFKGNTRGGRGGGRGRKGRYFDGKRNRNEDSRDSRNKFQKISA